jgi:hypothetical protein
MAAGLAARSSAMGSSRGRSARAGSGSAVRRTTPTRKPAARQAPEPLDAGQQRYVPVPRRAVGLGQDGQPQILDERGADCIEGEHAGHGPFAPGPLFQDVPLLALGARSVAPRTSIVGLQPLDLARAKAAAKGFMLAEASLSWRTSSFLYARKSSA